MLPVRENLKQPEWLSTFLRHSHRRQYPSKSTIIHSGDEPNTLYYIIDGSVSVVMEDSEGREIVLAYLNKGDFFGEMGLSGSLASSNSVCATRPVTSKKAKSRTLELVLFRRFEIGPATAKRISGSSFASRLNWS